MSYFRITLNRSAIGLPKRTRGVLAALGLHKRMQTVYHPVEAQFAGMIMKVKELVRVAEVDKKLTKWDLHAARKPDPGFYVESTVKRMEGQAPLKAIAAVSAQQKVVEGLTTEGGEEVRL
ncbi:putative mitochondrial LSU ribosomal protein L33 precursor [Podospora australis]|uniref:Large ribosomal subunit protein uL30m n=1 Tax=Podospora australis TaxID=1536484 RepID=A0AAN7AII6_9PEZI|nr:putative mitochondrial LSU ribosomal protein L33 precursor [Podospora australis]